MRNRYPTSIYPRLLHELAKNANRPLHALTGDNLKRAALYGVRAFNEPQIHHPVCV